ncbi:leucine-rich repeat-containing protein 74A [Nematostella vectensis]|uniref:leucine-rich repeat-containing protein 74A n=1 Tax=Nematostella vectensis TaxID=45351 RepID=UPI0020771BA3|nr:leucine-rich repeat-containing protein 74A [Nematostella vectensis]
MKTSSSYGNGSHNRHAISRQYQNIPQVIIRPVTAPGKHINKSSKPFTPSPPRCTPSPLPRRPNTTVGFYELPISTYTRPKSAICATENASNSETTPRTNSPRKGKGKRSQKSERKPKKSTHIAWDGDPRADDLRRNELFTPIRQPRKDTFFDANGNQISEAQYWITRTQKRRSAMKGMPLVPGSISTMVTFEESDNDDDDKAADDVQITRVPSFADVVLSDESSDFETDLEEDFPVKPRVFDPSGKNSYIKLCKEKDLVPVTFLTERLKEPGIVMRHHGLGAEGTLAIAKSLMKNTYTENLDLTDNYIGGPGGMALAEMLYDNCFITEIDLSMNFIRSEGGLAFAKMLHKNQSLRKLVLRSNHLTDKDAKAFAEALKENRTLIHLDLSHNEIGEMGGIFLGAGVASNYGLKHLDLSWNCIRFKGAVGMAQALKTNDCLTHFNMSWNGLSLLGCVALGRFLKRNEALKELDISNNRIGLLATQKLAQGIAAHPNLTALKVGKNPIGDGGVECLLNVIKAHDKLKYLSLEDITVSPKVFDEIKELEKERGVTIITGGIGGYKRPKEMPPGMRILLNFISENRLRLIDWFNQFDKDHSGGISREEFSKGLKETGLVMTKRQLDRLMEYIDINNDGEIEYSELLRGREMTIQELREERKIEERNKRIEEERMRLPKLEGYDYDLM